MINLSREGRVLLAHGTNLRVVANGVFAPSGGQRFHIESVLPGRHCNWLTSDPRGPAFAGLTCGVVSTSEGSHCDVARSGRKHKPDFRGPATRRSPCTSRRFSPIRSPLARRRSSCCCRLRRPLGSSTCTSCSPAGSKMVIAIARRADVAVRLPASQARATLSSRRRTARREVAGGRPWLVEGD